MGFKARVSIATCGGTYYGRRGSLTISRNAYTTNRNCSYHIMGPSGHYMRLWFRTLDLESSPNCTRDYVEMRDFNSTGEVLGRFCGSERGTGVATSANSVHVTFVTDAHQTDNAGFLMRFRASMEGCGGWRYDSAGELSSPGYPHGVPRRRRCIWRLQVPEGRRIRLETADWQLPPAARSARGCRSWLTVLDGIGASSPHLNFTESAYFYCAPDAPPVINSTGNQMTIIFSSRVGSTSARGFRMRYSSNEPALCGGAITSAPGSLASPQYPLPFGSPAECRWQLTLPSVANASTLVTFNAFSLPDFGECLHLSLRVKPDELGETTEVVCGNTTVPPPLHIPFTDFQLTYASPGEPWTSFFSLTYAVKPCGGLVSGPGQRIYSPGYPSDYPNGMDCAWLVEFEHQQTARVRFAWVDLGPGDYVSVLNGPGSTSPQLRRLTGSSTAAVALHGQSSRLLVVFHSDSSGQHRGFQAETESGCGGVYHTMEGAVESPEFPADYAASIECEWEVRAQPGYRLQLRFVQKFDLETSEGCQNDFVQAQWSAICGEDFTGESGEFSSPGYPNGYKNNLDCVYRILTMPQDYVTLNFVGPFFLEASPSTPAPRERASE
ncbi:cubilin-like [Pollicipes pollicipes]|uniref:cubilin-like n=1 Tax=Pollicipes pollicipes TaxID=41117 RepID=UPI001884F63E|nr:cubilin-like [Pollicipes pollicipes]